MSYVSHVEPMHYPITSPLVLSDRLLTLAQDADLAGFRSAAEHLLSLASKVLDSPIPGKHARAH